MGTKNPSGICRTGLRLQAGESDGLPPMIPMMIRAVVEADHRVRGDADGSWLRVNDGRLGINDAGLRIDHLRCGLGDRWRGRNTGGWLDCGRLGDDGRRRVVRGRLVDDRRRRQHIGHDARGENTGEHLARR